MSKEQDINDALAFVFLQASAQFGRAVKSYWFYNSDACPCCGRNVNLMRVKGNDAQSINAFIYRRKGVLIGYFLCANCATKIHRDAKRNPGVQTALHEAIERNLIAAYDRHDGAYDA